MMTAARSSRSTEADLAEQQWKLAESQELAEQIRRLNALPIPGLLG